jgi:MFS family permease
MQSTVKEFSGPGGTAAVQDGTRPFAAVALVMLSIVSVSYSLAQSLVNPGLQQLRVDFHASLAGISWILTAYLLSSAVLTPFPGRVGDHRGKERLLVATTGLLSAGSVLAAACARPSQLVGGVLHGRAPVPATVRRLDHHLRLPHPRLRP